MKHTLPYIILVIFFLQCKKTADITTINISQLNGLVQKGPFSSGTQVLMYELKKNLSQTGKIYTTTITDNRGTFQIKDINLISDYVLLSSNGFYYNEVLGSVSPSQLQLFALADIKDAASINVNILTHLEKRRVEYLVAQGKTFSASKKQAQSEILAVFGISNVTLRESEKLDISFAGDDNAILLAISVMLQGNLSVGELSELLSSIASDMEKDGTLDGANIMTIIKNNAFNLNTTQIRQNLTKRYQDLGLTATIPDFEKYILAFINKNVQLPTLSTTAATEISASTAKSGGTITSNGGAPILERGVVWSESTNPTITLTTKTSDGTSDGTFTSSITNLNPKTKYYIRAYATNRLGTAYGNEIEFTTSDVDITTGLVAYYPFNGNANDESGNGNHGTVYGPVLTTDRNGNTDKAFSFNGTSSHIYAKDLNQSYFENTDFSISIFSYFRNFNSDYPSLLWGENGYLIFQGVGGSNSVSSIGKVGFYLNEIDSPNPSQNGSVSSFAAISANSWHNLIIIKSGLTVSLYVDGNFSNSAPYYKTGKSLVSGSGMFFGNANASGLTFGFDGLLDDIRFYNRVLTQTEITHLATH